MKWLKYTEPIFEQSELPTQLISFFLECLWAATRLGDDKVNPLPPSDAVRKQKSLF